MPGRKIKLDSTRNTGHSTDFSPKSNLVHSDKSKKRFDADHIIKSIIVELTTVLARLKVIMPGYDLHESDRRNLPGKYFCSSCEKVLNDPVQTQCGHFYCRSCIDDLRESDRTLRCKIDNTWLVEDEIFPDKCVSREVLELIVGCPQKPCKWRGKLRNLQNHLWECIYILMPFILKGGEKAEAGAHHEECRGVKIETRKENSLPLPSSFSVLSDLSSMRGSDGGCFFEHIGCKIPKTLTVKQLREHNMRSIKHHISLLIDYVLRQEQHLQGVLTQNLETLNRQVSEQAEKILHLENATRGLWGFDVEAMLRRLINTENMNADLGVLIVELNTNIEDLRKKLTQSEKQQENQLRLINELKGRTDRGLQSPGSRNSGSLSVDEQFQLLSLSSFDGVMLWKISDVQRKRNEAMNNRTASVCSPPFYTDRYGYKMCLRLYFNGDGLGRGQCLSLFFVVMRGEYDALLRWPFQNKITLMLLDQNHLEHVIDAFKPDPSSSSFQRPRNAMNIASGCPMFCPLADLDNHAYVKDDTMFIKVIVDTSDSY